jgi:hypothetical protein
MIVQHSGGVCPPGEPPTMAQLQWNSQADFLSLSLSLIEESFSLGNMGKKL